MGSAMHTAAAHSPMTRTHAPGSRAGASRLRALRALAHAHTRQHTTRKPMPHTALGGTTLR